MLTLSAKAQDGESDGRVVFNKAEGYYDIGRFEQAIELLDSQNGKYPLLIKNNVLRLYALCYMALQDRENCLKYIKELLSVNPSYVSVSDPPRFRDVVEECKRGINTTITTASFSSETIEEAPVPVTVITAEMIRASGAHTIQDALLAFVPGVSEIENNGIMNFAYRGIYGSSQDKVLVMLNGIRLNSYYSNIAMTDYSVSVEKIKQIEVLRGPSSSLYGDAALSGVVNIITKDGVDMDGLEVSGAFGNFGQLKGGFLFGKHIYDFDISVWGSIYRSDGEKVTALKDTLYFKENLLNCMPDKVIIGGFNNKPSYDFGVNLKYKNFSLMYSCNSSKSITPYTKEGFGKFVPYSYYKYRSLYGNKPGAAYCTHNLKAVYEKQFDKFNFSLSACYTKESMSRYFVVTDTSEYSESIFDYAYDFSYDEEGNVAVLFYKQDFKHGLAKYKAWQDENLSLSSRFGYNYGSQSNGGTIIVGFDYSLFRVVSQSNMNVYDFDQIVVRNEKKSNYVFETSEPKNDFYLQLKHRFGRFIVNSGIRFDFKNRCAIYGKKINSDEDLVLLNPDRKLKEFSPRISFIYLLDRFSFKLNYSKAFVDATYYDRINETYLLFFNEAPKSQKIRSLQFTVASDKFLKGLVTELNFYYNDIDNLLDSRNIYIAGWNYSTIGSEAVIKFSKEKFNVNCNLSYLKAMNEKPFSLGYMKQNLQFVELIHNGNIFNIPAFSAKITAGYRFFDKMRFNVNMQYFSKRYFLQDGISEIKSEIVEIPQFILVNPSLNFDFKKLSMDFSVHNCFNHKYSIGGKCFHPIQQKGAWLMLEIKYRL